jgi:hypothetical protein
MFEFRHRMHSDPASEATRRIAFQRSAFTCMATHVDEAGSEPFYSLLSVGFRYLISLDHPQLLSTLLTHSKGQSLRPDPCRQ